MAKWLLTKIVFAIIFLALTSCATHHPPKILNHLNQGDYSYVKDYMTWFIQKEMKDKNIVGVSIALVDDQKIVWQQGFGYADRENGIKATPETIYRAGSISKLFNGMATMKLAETGQMNIDLPLVTYLQEFKIKSRFGNTDTITPRTIMTHHSGLPGNWADGMWAQEPKPFTQLVHDIKNEYVAYPPNTVMSYSNLGVTLLGHAVQETSGQKYAGFIDQALLQPMGMTNSRFETGISGSLAAKSYNKGEEVIESPLRDIPAGGLNTTVVDLAHLAMLVNNQGKFRNDQILSAKTLSSMFTVQNDNVPLDLGNKIGLAWFISDKTLANKETVYGHGGAVIAHRASFMVAPKSKLGVVVLANTGSAACGTIGKKLLQMAWEHKNGAKLPTEEETQITKHSDFTGTYATLIGKVSSTKKSTDHYKVKSARGSFNLELEEDNQYHLRHLLFGFIPINIAGLSEIGITTENISGDHLIVGKYKSGTKFLAGVRVEPHPIHEEWKKHLGHYKLLNTQEPEFLKDYEFELKIEDDYLVIVHNDNSLILRTVNAEEALTEGIGRSFGETTRIIKNKESGDILTFSGLQFQRTN